MHTKKTKKINKMDKILLILGIFIAIYVLAVLAFTWFGRPVPDSLTYSLLGTGAGECIVMGAIKNAKTKYNKGDDNEQS